MAHERSARLHPRAAGARRGAEPFRWFRRALLVLLGGYLFFGRPFAYLRVPGSPLFVGELVLLVGLFEAARVGRTLRRTVRRSRPLQVLLVFMAGCSVRLAVDLPRYGLDAVRDAAIWYYATFAFLVAAAILCNPRTLDDLLRWYRRVIPFFLAWVPVALVLSRSAPLAFVPGSETAINAFKPPDLAVHTGAALAFLLLTAGPSARDQHRLRLTGVIGLAALLLAGSQTRGGFAAAVVALALAAPYVPDRRRTTFTTLAALGAVVLALVVIDPRVELGGRELSLDQVQANVMSVVGLVDGEAAPDAGSLQDNIEWRLEFWERVRDDALAPENFLTGQGFGPILADRYGFQTAHGDSAQPLRSVHNSHLTVLARTGVPLALVWLLVWSVWAATVWPRHGHRASPEVRMRVWVVATVIAMLVNAFFDPSLEGPHSGIWLWTLVGAGVALAIPRAPSPGARPTRADPAAAPG